MTFGTKKNGFFLNLSLPFIFLKIGLDDVVSYIKMKLQMTMKIVKDTNSTGFCNHVFNLLILFNVSRKIHSNTFCKRHLT